LDVYKEDTEPLIEYYDKGSLTVKINAVGEVDDIYNLISKEF
jgi:adenylate kinase family enzyme